MFLEEINENEVLSVVRDNIYTWSLLKKLLQTPLTHIFLTGLSTVVYFQVNLKLQNDPGDKNVFTNYRQIYL